MNAPNLLKPTSDHDTDYTNALRNLPHSAHAVISASQELPAECRASTVWQRAHQAYWKMQTLEKNPEVVT